MIGACVQGLWLDLSCSLKADFNWVRRKCGLSAGFRRARQQSALDRIFRGVSQHMYFSSIDGSSVKVQLLCPVLFQLLVGYRMNNHDKTSLSVFLA